MVNNPVVVGFIIGLIVGSIITTMFLKPRKSPEFLVEVHKCEETGERVLTFEGNAPDGDFRYQDLLFSATVLTYKVIDLTEGDFDDNLNAFAEGVRDLKESEE